jgi:hypothetical protein
MRSAVVLVALLACDAGTRESPPVNATPPAPPNSRHVRIVEYGVELDVPADAKQSKHGDRIELDSPARRCNMMLWPLDNLPGKPATGSYAIGLVPVGCWADGCEDQCATLKAIDGLPEHFPSMPAAIVTRTHGGMAGGEHGGVSVWDDGTVIFRGRKCDRPPGPRAQVSADRVRALVVDLVRDTVLAHDDSGEEPGCEMAADGFFTSLTVRVGDAAWTAERISDCPWISAAIAAISETVGANPCF